MSDTSDRNRKAETNRDGERQKRQIGTGRKDKKTDKREKNTDMQTEGYNDVMLCRHNHVYYD